MSTDKSKKSEIPTTAEIMEIQGLAQAATFEKVFNTFVKCGYITDRTIPSEEQQKKSQERLKKQYMQTKKLLLHYRDLVWTLNEIPKEVAHELNGQFHDLDILLESACLRESRKDVISDYRLEQVSHTRSLIDYIHLSLTKLKTRPAMHLTKPGKKEPTGKDLYDVIYLTYISPEALSRVDVMDKLGLAKRTYYRRHDLALSVLTNIIWGANSPIIKAMIDVITELSDLDQLGVTQDELDNTTVIEIESEV